MLGLQEPYTVMPAREFLLKFDEITLNQDAISPAFLVLGGEGSLVLELQSCGQESRESG